MKWADRLMEESEDITGVPSHVPTPYKTSDVEEFTRVEKPRTR